MIYLSGLIGFLLVLSAEAKVGNSSQLPFCFETKQCLLFNILCKTDEYEVRHYDSVKWVSTDESSFLMEVAIYKSSQRLYEYIGGANQIGQKIDMAAPIIVKIPEKRFWETGTYTMSILLPAEYQRNPPKPTDNKVYISGTPDLTVYVKSYGGWVTSVSDKNTVNRLTSVLDLVGAEYIKGFHFVAGYNSPITIFNRHNEAWVVASDDPVCTSSEEWYS